MTKDDIAQKLALLPEGLEDENVQSWHHVVNMCEFYFEHGGDTRWHVLTDLIQKLLESEQTKLFRGGLSLELMMISTKEGTGLGKGDAYFYVGVKDNNVAEVGYRSANTQKAETFECKNNELFIKIQPLLDRCGVKLEARKMPEIPNQPHP